MYKRHNHSRILAIAMVTVIAVTNIATVLVAAVSRTEEETTEVERATHEAVKYEENQVLDTANIVYDASPVSYEVEQEEETIPEDETYVVQSGDSLWGIAEEFYGDGCYYPYIVENNDLEKEAIYQGQSLTITYFDETEADSILDECYDYMSTITQVSYSSSPSSSNNSSARNNNVPEGMTFVGNYKITGYDPWCSHCCGKSNGITASGAEAVVGRTIAAKGFPFGTKLYIEGYGTYVVEDTGGFKTNVIDIAASSHEACYALTAYNVPVYIVE